MENLPYVGSGNICLRRLSILEQLEAFTLSKYLMEVFSLQAVTQCYSKGRQSTRREWGRDGSERPMTRMATIGAP